MDGWHIAVPSPEFSNTINLLSSGFMVFEYHHPAPHAWEALTPFEQSLAAGFPERRKYSFMASRISLKLLSYRIGLIDGRREARTLETIDPKDGRPLLPGAEGRFYPSVSHDKRFSMTVADKRPIGVDIELISPRLIKGRHIFMNPEETAVADGSGLDLTVAATMVWTAKEAASKALNLHLIETWRAVRLIKLGKRESIFACGSSELRANHVFEWDRVVSVVKGLLN
ncbi:MAG: 4'-phosphopantetheinyl transferase superfamily protein [Deltaproteobacteria bacterium]|nr:4'-phosphopantetheinyl transferase superfamily protein [Deltaproteobacteria bacterium]